MVIHWFWRYVLAMAAGCGVGGIGFVLYDVFGGGKWNPVRQWVGSMRNQFGQTSVVVFFALIVPMTAAVAAYGLLTYYFGPRRYDAELHCRKCQYILRGLAEPRCPECGEPI